MRQSGVQSCKLPVLLSVAYLLYFAVNGSIFFDVHAQTFFLPFMLLAYYLEISGRYKLSFILFPMDETPSTYVLA